MDILQRGQSVVFVKKSTFLSYVFFFCKKSHKETFFDILDRKKEKRRRAQSMVFVKKSTFFSFFFLTKKSQKETFFDILDRKECFLDLKSEVLKNSKKWTVCKGVSPWFLSKNRPFSVCFFFQQKKPERNIFLYSAQKRMLLRPEK